MNGSPYLWAKFTDQIDCLKVKIIVECGSRDGIDSIALYNYYRPQLMYSFECNPEAIKLCKKNLKGYPNIKLIEKAVYWTDCRISFFPTDMKKSIDKNLGASSLLWHRDNKNEYFQKRINVDSVRLDTFMQKEGISHIDLLCMDVQGVELQVLEGLGDQINNVRYIITEAAFEHYYEGDCLFDDLKRFLYWKGFDLMDDRGFLLTRKKGLTDCLFKNRKQHD